MGLSTTPRTWVTGEIVTAALLNAEVRDAFKGIQAAWTAYTPTWVASTTNPSLGNGSITGKYLQIGQTILFEINLTTGSSTTYGSGRYDFSLPATPNNANYDIIGNVAIRDVSANLTYPRDLVVFSGKVHAVDQSGVQFGPTAPITLASGDLVNISGHYEAA